MKRGFLLAAKSITPIAAEIKWGSDSPYIRLCKTQECFRARLLPKPWLYRHHANTMRQRTLRAEVRVLLAYLDFFVAQGLFQLGKSLTPSHLPHGHQCGEVVLPRLNSAMLPVIDGQGLVRSQRPG